MPGVGTVDYLTNTSILKLDTVPRHLVVVGGSYIGLEFAQMYRRFGAEVTVVEKGPRLIAREDEDVSEAVREILADEGIVVRTNATCIGFKPHADGVAVDVDCTSGEPFAVGSHVLLAVGRRPNTDDLGLDKAGVAVDARGYIVVDDSLATNVPGIWALGDCNGRGAFTHTAYNDYEIVAANLLDGENRRVSDRIPAYALYVDPPLGRVGLSETEARRTRPPAAGVQAPDDAGRAGDREGRDQGLHEGGRRRGDEANPRRRHPGGGWRRGDPRHPGHDECRSGLSGPAMGGADPPDRLGTDPDCSRRPEAHRPNIVRSRCRSRRGCPAATLLRPIPCDAAATPSGEFERAAMISGLSISALWNWRAR